MGVSVESAGRGRKLDANLNLVPFIDLLSVCIIFLIATAVWIELSALPLEQGISEPSPPPLMQTQVPLTVHVRADGVWIGRELGQGRLFAASGDRYDWPGVSTALSEDRRTHESERNVVIVTDDGVRYAHMISALDLALLHGYEQPLLGGGPPGTNIAP